MRITVVIPMYKASNTIIASLQSVINQSYREQLEIIIVDDGTTDNSRVKVREYISCNKINRIIKLISQRNKGVSSARNMGIVNSCGEWIALLDSDDAWCENKLKNQIKVIDNNKDIKFLGSRYNSDTHPIFNKNQSGVFLLNIRDILFKWYPALQLK